MMRFRVQGLGFRMMDGTHWAVGAAVDLKLSDSDVHSSASESMSIAARRRAAGRYDGYVGQSCAIYSTFATGLAESRVFCWNTYFLFPAPTGQSVQQ